jgi:hypothetical protein
LGTAGGERPLPRSPDRPTYGGIGSVGAIRRPGHERPAWVDRCRSGRSRRSAAVLPCTNPLRGIGVVCGAYPAPEPLTDEASKVGALPQTPPGAEPLDLNTLMHVFDEVLSGRFLRSCHRALWALKPVARRITGPVGFCPWDMMYHQHSARSRTGSDAGATDR